MVRRNKLSLIVKDQKNSIIDYNSLESPSEGANKENIFKAIISHQLLSNNTIVKIQILIYDNFRFDFGEVDQRKQHRWQ